MQLDIACHYLMRSRRKRWTSTVRALNPPPQALADFVDVIAHLKSGNDSKYSASPVIAFGGSYGGMLAGMLVR